VEKHPPADIILEVFKRKNFTSIHEKELESHDGRKPRGCDSSHGCGEFRNRTVLAGFLAIGGRLELKDRSFHQVAAIALRVHEYKVEGSDPDGNP
jgi:hypothetical protein